MRIGELSSLMGVSKDTIQAWMDHEELNQFFSPGALLKVGAAQRVFTEGDVLALNTIRWLRYDESVTDWSAIAAYLNNGERRQEFPQNAVSADTRTIPIQQAEQSAKAMHTLAERDAAIEKVKDLQTRLDRVETEHKAEIERLQNKQQEITERLLREMGQLQRELGAALAKLEVYQGKGQGE